MTTIHPQVGSDYASGYVRGRHAAKEHIPITENPYRPQSARYRGWNDGHYDERSTRSLAFARQSAQIWTSDGTH